MGWTLHGSVTINIKRRAPEGEVIEAEDVVSEEEIDAGEFDDVSEGANFTTDSDGVREFSAIFRARRNDYAVLYTVHFVEQSDRSADPVVVEVDRTSIEAVSIDDQNLVCEVDYPEADPI
ncbi:hypothetical protein ACSFBX_34800 [Variovorax sp. RB2P76]|uniref:hypothetical protein n=1 Tax=Variovorax sp. RB2P76 TaxID=3443736 RepID=UPI003F4511BA